MWVLMHRDRLSKWLGSNGEPLYQGNERLVGCLIQFRQVFSMRPVQFRDRLDGLIGAAQLGSLYLTGANSWPVSVPDLP